MLKRPLQVEIKGHELVVRIGIRTLAFAATHGPYFDKIVADADGAEVVVTDEETFARAIADELRKEEEDGTTLVHHMLDKAAERAVEEGAEGIEIPEPAPPASA